MSKQQEYSKKMLDRFSFFLMACVTAQFGLAYMNRTEINADVTMKLVDILGASLIAYYIKTFFEKSSRNKYKLDSNGMPHFANEGEE